MLRAHGEDGVLRDGGDESVRHLRLPVGETEAAWRDFHGRLRAFVSRRVRGAPDVDDIVQKVFLEMHRSLPTLRSRDRLGPWLYRTARNAVIDHYRSPARRREVPSGDTRALDTPGVFMAPEEPRDSDDAPAASCLRPVVDRLPAPYRRAIDLIEIQGLPQRAAAEVEGISLSGMKARVQRARRHLKAALLGCCHFVLDGRGGVMACEGRGRSTAPCACKPGERGVTR